jgi:N-acetyl-gamma-glutamyl-phosphate reductase/acetylglutamate kinase
MRASEVIELYEQKYGGEKMCVVGKGVVDVKDAEGKHGWRVGGVQVHSSGKRVVVVVSCFTI